MTIEVSVVEAYCAEAVEKYLERGLTGPGDGTVWQHHDGVRYHISDFAKQDAPVVHRNLESMIEEKIKEGVLLAKAGSARAPRVRQKVDGCAKQYRSSKSCK